MGITVQEDLILVCSKNRKCVFTFLFSGLPDFLNKEFDKEHPPSPSRDRSPMTATNVDSIFSDVLLVEQALLPDLLF